MKTQLSARAACVCALLVAAPCWGAIFVSTNPGGGPTAAPPATLGGYAMGAFPADARPLLSMVGDAAPPALAPVAGNLGFSEPVELNHVGPGIDDWSTWSHGYAGNVYYQQWSELTLTLPVGTQAFYLYLEPELLQASMNFQIQTAVALTAIGIPGMGGASFLGIWSDDPSDPLVGVAIEQTTLPDVGFAVGEFGINVVPEPGFCGLAAGLGLLGLVAWRRMAK